MQRRDFIAALAAAGCLPALPRRRARAESKHAHCHPTYATPAEAIDAPPERYAFVPAICVGTAAPRPDYLATIDVDPESPSYSQVVGRFSMPQLGDELHHYGWNACSSCHGDGHRRYLIVPGLASGNIYVLDAADPRHLELHRQIDGKEIRDKFDLSTPHTVHCRADGVIMISMLGDAGGKGPGGFLEINPDFTLRGRWEKSTAGMHYNYDFWYQPRHNVMVSSEWAAPETVARGFHLEDVAEGKYGQRLHFWDWNERTIAQTIDLAGEGQIPLEVRFLHDPDSTHGFVGAALSSAVFHWRRTGDQWKAEKVIQVEPQAHDDWPFPVPSLITDVLISMDDRFLYFSNWLHGDVRQYDISNPARPKLTGQIRLGGVLGLPNDYANRSTPGGPQMLQLSLDGRRLYVTSSLYSVWDNQFYPAMAEQGSWMAQIDCDAERGGMKLNEQFFVDFGQEPGGPARAHEVRFPGGDCTSDIWV